MVSKRRRSLVSDAYLLEIKITTEKPEEALTELQNWDQAFNGFISKHDDDGTLRLWGVLGLPKYQTPAMLHHRIAKFLRKSIAPEKVTTRWRWVRWEHEFTTRGESGETNQTQEHSPQVDFRMDSESQVRAF